MLLFKQIKVIYLPTSPVFFNSLLQNLINSEVRDPQPKSGGDDPRQEDAYSNQRVSAVLVPVDVLTLEKRPTN